MKKLLATTALISALIAAPAISQTTLANNAFVTVSGTVGPITDGDEFIVNYGAGTIKVDTNDAWPNIFKRDATSAAKSLNEGDMVVVTGKIDNNWFTERELDAYALRFWHGGQVFNYEHATRVEGAPDLSKWNATDKDKDRVTITGSVAEVVNKNRYKVRFGGGTSEIIEIDTTGVTGGKAQHFAVGDRVHVTGKIGDTLFNKREINVDTVQKL